MKITITPAVKSTAVSLGAYMIFGQDKAKIRSKEERVKRFDEIWDSGLNNAVQQAIEGKKTIPLNVADDILRSKYRGANQYLDARKKQYQFTYKVICIIQVEYIEQSDEYIADQFWSFAISDTNPERFCFSFDSVDEREAFESFVKSLGQDVGQFARRAVIQGRVNIEQQEKLLEIYRGNLAHFNLQRANVGLIVPIHLINEINSVRENIKSVKQILREWGLQVADHPDD